MKLSRKKLRNLIAESIEEYKDSFKIERLLLERKSDIAYRNFAIFFFDYIFKLENFVIQIAPGGTDVWTTNIWFEKINPAGRKYTEHNKQFTGVILTLKYSKISKLWQDYQKLIPYDKDVFFNGNIDNFKKWILKLVIGFLDNQPHTSGAGGTMSPKGIMRISNFYKYVRDKDLPGVVEGDKYSINKSLQLFFQNIGSNLDSMRMLKFIITHELVHYMNAIRADGEPYRAKGGMKQFQSGTQEYHDSTEEIQARIITGQQHFLRVSQKYASHAYKEKVKIYELLSNGLTIAAVSHFMKTFGIADFFKYSPKNRKRIMKRIKYFFDNEVMSSEEYMNWKEINTIHKV